MDSPRKLTPSDSELEALTRARLDDWRQRLIDLTLRNRLINYRPTKSTTLRVTAPSIHNLLADPARDEPFDFYLPPEPSDDIVESDVVESNASAVDTEPRVPRDGEVVTDLLDPKRLTKVLGNLARRSNAEFADKALRVLYLAVGFLTWDDPTHKQSLRSPLVMVPVELKRESVRDPYRLYFAEDEEIVINPALTLKLERDAGVTISDTWAWEDKPLRDELNDIRDTAAEAGWQVDEDAVIGLFSFQKMVMYRDLQRNEDKVVGHSAIQLLSGGSRDAGTMHDAFSEVPSAWDLDRVQDPRRTFSGLLHEPWVMRLRRGVVGRVRPVRALPVR